VSDVTALQGSQSETTIAIDPSDSSRVFAASNDNSGRNRNGMTVSRSSDGGVTWTAAFLGDGSDAVPVSRGDPKAAYDVFGNLFLTYLTNEEPLSVVVLLSVDGGQNFKLLTKFTDLQDADQPSIAVGPGRDGEAGSVWLTWEVGEAPF